MKELYSLNYYYCCYLTLHKLSFNPSYFLRKTLKNTTLLIDQQENCIFEKCNRPLLPQMISNQKISLKVQNQKIKQNGIYFGLLRKTRCYYDTLTNINLSEFECAENNAHVYLFHQTSPPRQQWCHQPFEIIAFDVQHM